MTSTSPRRRPRWALHRHEHQHHLSLGTGSKPPFIDGAGIGLIDLHCRSYPNDTIPSGYTDTTPPGLPISPVIATAGQATPPAAPHLDRALRAVLPPHPRR